MDHIILFQQHLQQHSSIRSSLSALFKPGVEVSAAKSLRQEVGWMEKDFHTTDCALHPVPYQRLMLAVLSHNCSHFLASTKLSIQFIFFCLVPSHNTYYLKALDRVKSSPYTIQPTLPTMSKPLATAGRKTPFYFTM